MSDLNSDPNRNVILDNKSVRTESTQRGVDKSRAESLHEPFGVRLTRTASDPTLDQALWVAIRNRTHAISFDRYRKFINRALSSDDFENAGYVGDRTRTTTGDPVLAVTESIGVASYSALKHLTETFLMLECGVRSARGGNCLAEAIWSYWMEEGMLVKTMHAIAQRFQNIRKGDADPLANLEIDPLRPLNNLLWGFIQHEADRLWVRRRPFEYSHQYGLTFIPEATPGEYDRQSREHLLDAFHDLLRQSSVFPDDHQSEVVTDALPLLNALKRVHLAFVEGSHNQFGDLPWTARAEIMLIQYVFSRPEVVDFLKSDTLSPHQEHWEASADKMKSIQGWTDVPVSQFRDLAALGEQLLLSVRFGDWMTTNDEQLARNWARYFRPEIKGYIFAYRTVAGVDLTGPAGAHAAIPNRPRPPRSR